MNKNWISALLVSSSFALMATFAAAQMEPGHGPHKQKPQQQGGGMGMHMHMHEMECPMMQAGHVEATATVENVAGGAVIRLRAKQSADAPRVQELAKMIAKHIEEGCPKQGASPAAATPKP